MKTTSIIAAIGLMFFNSSSALASDVNVGVSISGEIQPGIYGQVNIGTVPNYSLLYPQPVVVVPAHGLPPQAVYMHVPPGHAKNWSKHCQKYNACGRPVYFIKSAEYDGYHAADEHGHHKKQGKGHGNGKGKHKDKH